MADTFVWKALDRFERSICTVVATDGDAAKVEVERQLGKNPSRTAYLEGWLEIGKPVRLVDLDNAKGYKPRTTAEGYERLHGLVHDHGDPTVLVYRVAEGTCPVCGSGLVVAPGTWEDDRVTRIVHWCPDPGCGVAELTLAPVEGGDWVVEY